MAKAEMRGVSKCLVAAILARPASNNLSQVEARSDALGAGQGGSCATAPDGPLLKNGYNTPTMRPHAKGADSR
jgi:hypothetical protein